MKKEKNILSQVSSVMVIMVLSRLLSLLSVQIYMSYFGASDAQLNVYSYAISIPNIIFTCIGTALSTVVIPIYVGHIANNNLSGAKKFADNIITISLLLTAVLVGIGIAISPILPKFTAFQDNQEIYDFAVKSLITVMPVMFFYALNYIFQGMLQAVGRFKLPAFVSVPSSLIVIFYTIFLWDKFYVEGLLIATLIGLAMQALILIPPLLKEGYRFKISAEFKNPDIIKAGKMTLPVLLGVGAYQLNMLYNVTMIARFDGMVTLLNYVQNITLYLVLAIIYSITAVVYPRLTESAARGDMKEYKDTLLSVLSGVCALLIPISFGFVGVRETLLNLIAAWGKMTDADVFKASVLLAMYAVGVLGIGLKEILDRALYAIGNTKTSAYTGVVIMLVNVGLSLILIRFMGAYGIPLAYSIASLTGMLLLLYKIKKQVGSFAKGLFKTVVKCIVAAAVMLLFVEQINFMLDGLDASLLMRAVKLFVPAGAGVLIYYVMAVILKIRQVTDFASKLLKRGK